MHVPTKDTPLKFRIGVTMKQSQVIAVIVATAILAACQKTETTSTTVANKQTPPSIPPKADRPSFAVAIHCAGITTYLGKQDLVRKDSHATALVNEIAPKARYAAINMAELQKMSIQDIDIEIDKISAFQNMISDHAIVGPEAPPPKPEFAFGNEKLAKLFRDVETICVNAFK